jgi:rfaE bifunctional protein nucleotidyltransferase chain/domain
LTDLEDPEVRSVAETGVSTTIQSNLAHLRSIKETELKWLELLAVVSLASVGYILAASNNNPIIGWAMSGPVISFFLFVAWIQFVLASERLSYYGVMRSVVRGQNLLGLYEMRFLAPRHANSAFPKGMGPDPATNGTQPFSSFLHRQIYSTVLLASIVSAATFRVMKNAPDFWKVAVAVLVLDVLWLVHLFLRDRRMMSNAWKGERTLAGADPSWFKAGAVVASSRHEAGAAQESAGAERFVAGPGFQGSVVARDQVAELGRHLRSQGKRVVATNGHFDLLHVGHVQCLAHARALGDCLVVAINDDEATRRRKGPGRPIVPAADRARVIAGLGSVDYVLVFGEETAEQVVRELKPDVYVKGGDYAGTPEGEAQGAHPLPEARIVEDYGGEIAIFPLVADRSTTDIEARILAAHGRAPSPATTTQDARGTSALRNPEAADRPI